MSAWRWEGSGSGGGVAEGEGGGISAGDSERRFRENKPKTIMKVVNLKEYKRLVYGFESINP